MPCPAPCGETVVRSPDCGCASINIGMADVEPTVKEVEAPAEVQIKQVKSTEGQAAPFPRVEPKETVEVPLPEFGHDENYGWLLGRLQKVHSPTHQWKVRYAPLDKMDKWGGSMVLALDARLDEFEDGDPVYIEGEILEKRPSLYLTGPLYRANVIRHAEDMPHITSRLQSTQFK